MTENKAKHNVMNKVIMYVDICTMYMSHLRNITKIGLSINLETWYSNTLALSRLANKMNEAVKSNLCSAT